MTWKIDKKREKNYDNQSMRRRKKTMTCTRLTLCSAWLIIIVATEVDFYVANGWIGGNFDMFLKGLLMVGRCTSSFGDFYEMLEKN